MTLRGIIDETIATLLDAHPEEASYEGRLLVQEALDLTLSQVMSHPDRELDAAAVTKIRAWTALRRKGQPLAYLARRRGFYKNDFIVEPGVLVPRPETELVVETAIRRANDFDSPVGLLADLGCGSGCIGLSLLCEMSAAHLNAIDAAELACAVTERNARALGVDERTSVECTSVDRWRVNHRFDLIVANPPYIPDDDPGVEPGVRAFEPALALFGGADGLRSLRDWSAWAFRHLEVGGVFVCEFGVDQGRAMREIFDQCKFTQVQVERDLAGIDRVISGLRSK